MKKIMLTRSRSTHKIDVAGASAANAVDTEKKRRKIDPPESSRRTTVAKVNDVTYAKSKEKLDLVFDGQQSSTNDNSSNTQKNPQKSKRSSTVTKWTVKQTKSKPSKNTETESNSLASITEKTNDLHACYNAIEQVLATNYTDVQKRLKLPYPAKCIHSLVTCSKEHARNSNMAISANITAAYTFLKNHQPLMFMHVILMDVLSGKFPGRNLMPLFELIVSINEPSLGEYDVANVIDTATFTIARIIERFPPCWLAANKEYRTFLQAKEKHLISGKENFSANHTLFEDLINCVESVIQAPAKSKTAKHDDTFANNSLFNDSLLNESHDLQCFSKWESKHTQKYSFDILPRDQKIHRIFTALSLHVLLFEADLAMWTLRNIKKTNMRIFDRQKGPLIGSVLWSKDEPNQVNYTIKNILKLFVDYVSIDFPSDETNILSRLVNVMFNVFDLYSFRVNHNVDCVDYPQPLDEQNFFCDALIKIIFDSSSCCIDLWFKIIKNILHPKLKLCLINALMTKIEHKKITLTPETIYKFMRELETNFDDIFDKTSSQNNNVVKTKEAVVRTAVGGDSKYPHLQKIHKRVASELSYEQQAELNLIALRAYMDIFHIDEVQDYWRNYDRYTNARKLAMQRYNDECNTMQHEPVEPYDVDRMQKWQKIPFDTRIKDLAENGHGRIHPLDVMYEVDGIRFLPNVDVKKYRNDGKFVDLISDEMKQLRTKFDALFPIRKYSK